ncbi:hypothetical protein V8E36_008862, partial [Tilletia maclaganii]
DDSLKFVSCASVISQADDVCKRGDFVSIERPSRGSRREEYKVTIARVESIWSASDNSIVLLRAELFTIKKGGQYPCAQLVGQGQHVVIEAKRLVQLLNVQHDCLGCGCKVDGNGRTVRVERQVGAITVPAIQHAGARAVTQKYILNEFLHRLPAAHQAALTIPAVTIPDIELDAIVAEAMKTMPPARQHKAAASRNGKRRRVDDEEEEERDEFSETDEE